ncbi:hypothetical protein AKJ09_02877 [Labilithrix luteola]|uniref:Uncharacterized protein n=1 Tax=Labilithrix luteola TaxID=1391654 RepID=A0A0K1PRR3_9BACT|nr:hypothetical protein [Labilithrix luteola]AKU96213.1 hypothetical protein AKJ09_02877 [Labilithrix luteola]
MDDYEDEPLSCEEQAAIATDFVARLQKLASHDAPEAPGLLGRMVSPIVQGGAAQFDRACVLVRRRTRLEARTDTFGRVEELADGSAIIVTTIPTDLDELAWRLSDDDASFLAEHDDERGIPVFSAAHLERVRSAFSYDEALAILGDETAFLVPRTELSNRHERRP